MKNIKPFVSWPEVVELCEELGVVKRHKDQSDDEYEDSVAEEASDDPDIFLTKYTAKLLDAIEVGSSNLTGKREHYKGFGKRISENSVCMIVKTSCGEMLE